MSIRIKLPLMTLLVVVISLVVSSAISYHFIAKETLINNQEHMKDILHTGTISFEHFFQSRKLEVAYLSENVLVQETIKDYYEKNPSLDEAFHDDYTEMNQYFTTLKLVHSEIDEAFMLTPTGYVMASSHPKSLWISLKDREYYQDAMQGQATISNLLTDRVDGRNVLFVAAPIYGSNHEVLGVIANIIDSEIASGDMKTLIVNSVGESYLMTESGQIIFHENDLNIGQYHKDSGVLEAFTSGNVGLTGDLEYEKEGENIFLVYEKIPDTPWYLVIEQNQNELLSDANLFLSFSTLLFLALIVIIAFVIFKYSSFITEPISQLRDVMKQTTKGDLSVRSQHMSHDELGELSVDLNYMLDELTGAYEELESKNEELVAQEEELRANFDLLEENRREILESKMRIEHLALKNQVTELDNQLAYKIRIKELVKSSDTKAFILYHIDIDNFMRINDSLGHKFGNETLRTVALRMIALQDKMVEVYHLSGDEFAVIEKLLDPKDQLVDNYSSLLNDAIYTQFNDPYIINGKTLYLSASIGITQYPKDDNDVDKLIQNAETAMYSAKRNGKSTSVFYNKIMSESLNQRFIIEDLLRHALPDNLVTMHYQPQYDIESGKFNAYESLMRLQTPEGKPVSPAIFIPIAEETGLIHEYGLWAVKEVLKIIKLWRTEEIDFSHISVNVSGIQLQQPDFYTTLTQLVEKAKVNPHDIELEITESIFLDYIDADNQTLKKLKDYGFKIALDDFGTGYSSFGYLRTMPLTSLKIDKSFIDNITHSAKDRELVKQMINIGHDLGFKIIAEGVENVEQYNILNQFNCDYIQGYYFSKPLPIEDVIAYINM